MKLVVTGHIALHQPRPRKAKPAPKPRPMSSPRRGDRTARMLGLAHRIEQAIEDGALRDHAHAADLLGVTRARMSQIMALQNLAPDIQGRILAGDTTIYERNLRAAIRSAEWGVQRTALNS